MLPAELKPQHAENDKRSNESDLLLSNRYILTKEIKDLNKALLDSNTTMRVLENDVKNLLKLKTISDSYILAFDEIEKEPGLLPLMDNALHDLPANRNKQIDKKDISINVSDSQIHEHNECFKSGTDKNTGFQNRITELIEKFKNEPEFQELLEIIKMGKCDFIRVMQLLIDNNQKYTNEINILREKIAYRNEADSDVIAERENLIAQLKSIQDEIIGLKLVEDEESL
jgi:hypothetical protein